jgi:hypothetical protein
MAIGLKFIDGDFIVNLLGKAEISVQEEKCARDFGKMLITSKEFAGNETNFLRYNPNYGTDLDNTNLFVGLSRATIRDVVISILNANISNYVAMQESRNNLDYGEIITNVNFEVYYDADDLRKLLLDIKISTALGGEPISVGQFTQTLE